MSNNILKTDGYPNGAKSFDKPGRYIVRLKNDLRIRDSRLNPVGILRQNQQFETYIDRYGNFSVENERASYIGMFNIGDTYHWEKYGPLMPPVTELYPDLKNRQELNRFDTFHNLMGHTITLRWHDRNRQVFAYECSCSEVAIATVPYPFCNQPHECAGYGTCQRNIACSE